MHWEIHDVDNLAALERLAERTAALVQEAPDASIKHDLAFLASKLGAPGTRLKICLLTDSARVDGLACFVDEPNKLVFSLGPVTLLRLSVRRLVINVAPLLSARLNAEDCESQSALLANTICQGLQAKGVVLLQAVDQSSPLMRYVTHEIPSSTKRGFHAVRHGKSQRHWRVTMARSFDDYLKRMNMSRRSDLKRALKRFASTTGGQWTLRRFTHAESVKEFLDLATPISARTWQYLDQDAGLRNRQALEVAYQAAAALGRFRAYVLLIQERPVAFRVGYVYKGAYYSEMTGYDPEAARQHVGVVLFLETLKDLIATGDVPNGFDHDSTENDLKRRVSDQSTLEATYYLFPRTAVGTALAIALGTVNRTSSLLGQLRRRHR